jgi:DNA polymerase III alpha subunit (gram-positive type)
MEFVAIDFEKLNDSQLSVCEVGLVAFKDGKEVKPSFHSYINPYGGFDRNDWAKKHLSHISDKMLLEAPPYDKLFPILRQKIQDKILVVHSKGADLNYLYHLEEHYNLPKLYSKWADTNEIARSLGKCENLPDLYSELFDVPFTEHHKALDDARACGLIFEQLSSQVNIRQFIHEENYLPTDKKREYDATNTRHTQYGTATVAPDGLVFNYDKILNKSFFKDKKVALSGMSVIDNNRIKSILTDSLGAKCTSKPSGKTDVFIINQNNVGPSKRIDAIRFQQTTGLLIITDDYFWELI